MTCSMTSNSVTTSKASEGEAGCGSCSIDVFKYVSFPGDVKVGSRLLCASAMDRTCGVGSMAVTDVVVGRRAADSAKMPPPQPMSRYRSFSCGLGAEVEERHWEMKVWRSGFMRWSRREGPWGSHHDEARALKCDTSVGSTVEVEFGVGLWCRDAVVDKPREGRGIRSNDCVAATWLFEGCGRLLRNERNARAVFCGFITVFDVWVGVRAWETRRTLMSPKVWICSRGRLVLSHLIRTPRNAVPHSPTPHQHGQVS